MIFMGDTHGLKPIFELVDKNKIQDSNIIHVGDLGLGFQEITRDVNNLLVLDEMLIETNNKLYVIRGNHDNPMFWGIPAGLNLPKLFNVILVKDHILQEIEGKRIYFAGGAISIDRSIRKIDSPPTWWKNEEYMTPTTSIPKNIDIVVSHNAPDFAKPIGCNAPIVNDWSKIEKDQGNNLKVELILERSLITNLYHDIAVHSNPKYWFYGHFHGSFKTMYGSTEFIGLNINELKEIN